jgi:aspartokinase-like uncharacterized kinase
MSGASGRPLVRVVKVGGSLLDWPPLPQALATWLREQPLGWNVLLAGGGELANVIRRADATFQLGEEASHWLCIELMGSTARLLAAILDQPTVIAHSLAELRERFPIGPAGQVMFDPRSFLSEDDVLPQTWSVTSDSIAARLADAIAADELVLLKSADPPAGASLTELAANGMVDAFFPQAAAALTGRVRIVNLRSC